MMSSAVAVCWNLVRLPRAPPSARLSPRVRWARRSSTWSGLGLGLGQGRGGGQARG